MVEPSFVYRSSNSWWTKYIGSGEGVYERTATGAPVGVRAGDGTNPAFYVLDALGSVVGVFDSIGSYIGGYSYDPYGQTRYSAIAPASDFNHLRYIGGYYDSESGMYNLGARFYDQSLGRFTQADPSGQEAAPYGYAGDNPINGIDPSGRSGWDILSGLAGAVICAYLGPDLVAVACGVLFTIAPGLIEADVKAVESIPELADAVVADFCNTVDGATGYPVCESL